MKDIHLYIFVLSWIFLYGLLYNLIVGQMINGKLYRNKNGSVRINFGTDFDFPFEHGEALVAEWKEDEKRLVIARLKDLKL